MSEQAEYFSRLSAIAHTHGEGRPRLLLDLARLDQNIEHARALAKHRALRLVVKSLPSPDLLRYAARRLGSDRFMCFHWPFLVQLAHAFPAADFLLGKPLPVEGLQAFFRCKLPTDFDPQRRIAWLIDGPRRLAEYATCARARDLRLRIAIEIDVGMHRGGVASPEQLAEVLVLLRAERNHLSLAGFMGYDAHAAKAPWPHTARSATSRSAEMYRQFVAHVTHLYPDLVQGPLLLNGAGSPTFALHNDQSPLTEVSIGSVLVKPSSFDLASLAAFLPAAWIAAPILKRLSGTTLPFLEWLARLRRSRKDTLFIYGGKWMADPVWPPGVRHHALYGLSSNQQCMSIPRACPGEPNDHLFLRPSQSEAVLLEFGDLLAVEGDGRVHFWPTLQNEVAHG